MSDGKKNAPKPKPEAVSAGEKRQQDQDPKSGQFLPGNRAGKGNPNLLRVKAMREALQEAASPEKLKKVLEAMAQKALEGDVQAGRLVLEFSVGKPRRQEAGDTIQIDLPNIENVSDIAVASGRVIEAVGSGEITLGEAQALAGMLGSAGKLLEMAAIEARLAAVEEKVADLRYL